MKVVPEASTLLTCLVDEAWAELVDRLLRKSVRAQVNWTGVNQQSIAADVEGEAVLPADGDTAGCWRGRSFSSPGPAPGRRTF
jgi:hypothetical protein